MNTIQDEQNKRMNRLERELENYKKENEDLKQKNLLLEDSRNQIINFYEEEIDGHFNFKTKTRTNLSKVLLDLERKRQLAEYYDLSLKKLRYGFKIETMNDTGEEWMGGTELTTLHKKRKELIEERNLLNQEHNDLKKIKKKTIKKEKEVIKQSMSVLLKEIKAFDKKIDEIEKEIKEIRKHRYEIHLREQLLHKSKDCFFSKSNHEIGLKPWPLLFDRYQILSLIGRGGFAEVYKAYDLIEFRYIVCKTNIINKSASQKIQIKILEHIKRENEVLEKLKHPNIVRYYDTIQIDEYNIGTVLEYCEGKDLNYMLKSRGVINDKEAINIIKQIVKGVRYLHEQNPVIIHYDLKPMNILFDEFGNVKITDFGVCKLFNEEEGNLSKSKVGGGTYWYLPPECFDIVNGRSEVNGKVDVWSIGIIFFEILFGKIPFGDNISQDRFCKERKQLWRRGVVFPKKPNVSEFSKFFILQCLKTNQKERISIFEAFKLFFE